MRQPEEEEPEVQTQSEEEEEPEVQAQPEEEEEPEVQAKGERTPVVTPQMKSELDASRGAGAPLPREVRAFMEPRFGRDFSGVRVHTGSRAASLAKGLRARAFTRGSDVYFASGKYAPATAAGKRLVAHELAHTVHEKGSIVPRAENEPKVMNEGYVSDIMPIINLKPEEAEKHKIGKYKVKKKDTLTKIARLYGMEVEELKKLSGLASDKIKEGQVIAVPAGKCPATTRPENVVVKHEVSPNVIEKPGDKAKIEYEFGCAVVPYKATWTIIGAGIKFLPYLTVTLVPAHIKIKTVFIPHSSKFIKAAIFKGKWLWNGKGLYKGRGNVMLPDGDYRSELSNVVFAYDAQGKPKKATPDPHLSKNVIHIKVRAHFGKRRFVGLSNLILLSKLLATEANAGYLGIGLNERKAVAWTVRHRMIQTNTENLSTIIKYPFYAFGKQPQQDDSELALKVLAAPLSDDPINGATHYISPINLHKKKPKRGKWVKKTYKGVKGKFSRWAPYWVDELTTVKSKIPERLFIFYK